MKISIKSQYALEALIDLTLHAGDGQENTGAIAARRGISEHYLEQILAALRKAGIVASIRGAQGGYRLSRPPQDITAGEVIRALEGPLTTVKCVLIKPGEEPCPMAGRCATQPLWTRLTEEIDTVIDSVTLSDLLAAYESLSGQTEPEYCI